MGAKSDLHKARASKMVSRKPSKVFLKNLNTKGKAEYKQHLAEIKMTIQAQKSVKADKKVKKALKVLEGILG